MESEFNRELTETIKVLTDIVKLQQQVINDQLIPCFCIVTALVKNASEQEQKNLIALLRSLSESVESLVRDERILESPYEKAANIVSALSSGGSAEIVFGKKLQVILGGKKN